MSVTTVLFALSILVLLIFASIVLVALMRARAEDVPTVLKICLEGLATLVRRLPSLSKPDASEDFRGAHEDAVDDKDGPLGPEVAA